MFIKNICLIFIFSSITSISEIVDCACNTRFATCTNRQTEFLLVFFHQSPITKTGKNWTHHSPEKHFWAINKLQQRFKYTRRLIKSHYYLSLEKGHGPSSEQTQIPFTQGYIVLSWNWLKLAQWFWRRRSLNVINVFSLLFSLGKAYLK